MKEDMYEIVLQALKDEVRDLKAKLETSEKKSEERLRRVAKLERKIMEIKDVATF